MTPLAIDTLASVLRLSMLATFASLAVIVVAATVTRNAVVATAGAMLALPVAVMLTMLPW